MNPTVVTERHHDVLVVTINRPELRNAVDGSTAAGLVDAFDTFESDDTLRVAILTGAGGTFCSGADLGAVASGRGNRVERDVHLDGPMGPTRRLLSKPVIAAVEGYAVAGGWSSPCGATCALPARAPCSGCSADAGACRSSTAARCACRASSARGERST
jgi:enoyl-CoA hydratase/carnithine racemase